MSLFDKTGPDPDRSDLLEIDEQEVQRKLGDDKLTDSLMVGPTGGPAVDFDARELAACRFCGTVSLLAHIPLEIRHVRGKGMAPGVNIAGWFCPGCDNRLVVFDPAWDLDVLEKGGREGLSPAAEVVQRFGDSMTGPGERPAAEDDADGAEADAAEGDGGPETEPDDAEPEPEAAGAA